MMTRDEAKKSMLLGVRFALRLLGVEKDGLLTRFVEQEFQTWVEQEEERQRGPQGPIPGKKKRATAAARSSRRKAA